MANIPCQTDQRPRILQWNYNHLGPRHSELAEQLLWEDFDLLTLQDTNVCGRALRLQGHVCHVSARSCSLRPCTSHPCPHASHTPCQSQAAVYVRAPVNLTSIVDGPMECTAVTLRMGSTETTVASVYVRPAPR